MPPAFPGRTLAPTGLWGIAVTYIPFATVCAWGAWRVAAQAACTFSAAWKPDFNRKDSANRLPRLRISMTFRSERWRRLCWSGPLTILQTV